jgi:hypothetical protein
MRPRRPAALATAVLLAACDGTSPAPRLDGVWAGRVALFEPTDSLTLAVATDGSEVRGFGIHRPSDNPRTYFRMYVIYGTLTGRSAELYLTAASGSPPTIPPTTLTLRATLSDGELSGTLTAPDGDKSVTLRRSDPRGGGAEGTYALASTSGLPAGQTLAIRDTIVAFPDGRARRHRETQSFRYGTLAVWSRRGDWMMLEQLAFGFDIPFLDSLRIESRTLVRTTRFVGGVTAVETYTRVP